MSKGKRGFLVAVLVLGVACVGAGPVAAQLTISSTTAAGVDDRAPGPIAELKVEVDFAGPGVALSWQVSDDDFARPSPIGTDFTSGGTFVSVNDVAGYTIQRSANGGEFETIAELGAGETSFTDDTVISGISYVYQIAAADAAGNQSGAIESELVTLGPPAESEVEEPSDQKKVQQVTLRFDTALDVEDEAAVEDFTQSFIELLAAELGIPVERIRITGIFSGSVIVEFEIIDDPADPAAEVATRLSDIVENEPEVFADLGPVLSFGAQAGGSLDLGAVGPDQVVSQTYSFTNTATDPEAILIVTAAVEGAGYELSATSLSLAAGETGSFDVSFDAAAVGNLNGDYPGVLNISSNDPNAPSTRVDLAAAVEGGLGPAAIDLSGRNFNFAAVVIGETKSLTLTIKNVGDTELQGDLSLEGDGVFSISQTSFALAGGEEVDVAITFAPTEAVASSGTLIIASNDAAEPEALVSLSGTGVEAGGQMQLVDENGNVILGDINVDATVNFDDFFLFADSFGKSEGEDAFEPLADLDANATVNFDDFFLFADNFGKSGTYVTVGGG